MMTPDELHMAGYCIQYGTWGGYIFQGPSDMDMSVPPVKSVQFDRPMNSVDGQAELWRHAELHLVETRLTK